MLKKTRLYQNGVLVLGALLYALLYAVCSQIDQYGALTLGVGGTALRFAGAFPVALVVLWVFFEHVLPRCAFGREARRKCRIWPIWLFLLCCYIPVFLIVYPGSFTYDSMTQIAQIASGEYDAFHPLLHTLLIRVCLSLYDVLQSMEKCGAVYSLIQMVCVSGIFAYVCASVSRCISYHAAKWVTAFFALYPSHMAFASNCTKDVFFSACLLLFFLLCCEEIMGFELSARQRALRLAMGMLACLLRNNMIYAMAAWCAVMLIAGRRWWRMLLSAALSIVLATGVNAGLMKALDADDGNVREMLSIPLQQLARAKLYAPEAFGEEESAYLDTLIRDEAYYSYNPTISDNVKNAMDEDVFLANPAKAMKLWLSVGKKCPAVYLDAFLNQTYPSLYPYSHYMHDYDYIDIGSGTALTAPFGLPRINPPARFEAARQWLRAQLFRNGADEHVVLRWVFNTGGVFWLLLAAVLYDVYCRKWWRVLLFMLPVFLWGTYLLGPIMYGRYLYPFICMLPLFILRPAESGCADSGAAAPM